MSELLGGDTVIDFEAVSSSSPSRASSSRSAFASSRSSSFSFRRRSKGEEQVVEALQGESSQFQVVLKQLGKRDTTTKLKVGVATFLMGRGR